MKVPEHFSYAFSGLEQLVEEFSSGATSEEEAGREAIRWLREDARGSLTLAKAAVFATRHEAATQGFGGDAGKARATLRALDLVERRIDPPEDPDSPPKMPTPARLPEAIRKRAPNARGFRLGRVEIIAEPGPGGWQLSVSHPERFPTFEELMLARGITGDPDKTFAAVIPAASAPPDGRGGRVVDVVEAGIARTAGRGR